MKSAQVLFTLLVFSLSSTVLAHFTPKDHEIFRLKDELELHEGPGVTFYDFIGIPSIATQKELDAAYRKKSRLLHPDKARQAFLASRKTAKAGSKTTVKPPTKAELKEANKIAQERFARLGVIANILRGESRERYDHFLKNGFPRWKGFGYAYNRYRPGLGAVLTMLFIFGGGGAHYGAMYLSWKRQREFMARYISDARKAAWGDSIGVRGLPNLEPVAAPPQEEEPAAPVNRKQRRLQEKQSKKGKPLMESPAGSGNEGTGRIDRSVERRKVTAENGKVLIVDSYGNVALIEEDEDGNSEEYPLNLWDIKQPTIQDTVLFRLPIWAWSKSFGKVFRPSKSKASAEDSTPEADVDTDTEDESKSKKRNGTTKGGFKRRTQSARARQL